MKKNIILFLTIVNSAVLRLYQIGLIPPQRNPEAYLSRMISASSGVISIFIVYLLSGKYFKNSKIALLVAFVMSILPWTLEENRVISQVNIALLVLLLAVLVYSRFSKSFFKYLTIIPFLILFYIVFPEFWFFRETRLLTFNKLLDNFLMIFSSDLWFFHNITFYHGGLRQWGIILISFLPFLLIGIYRLIIKKKVQFIYLVLIIGVIASLSPFFPESREFYFSTPIISIILGNGLYQSFKNKSIAVKFFLTISVFLISYELSGLLHFYFIHYPKEVLGSMDKITFPY